MNKEKITNNDKFAKYIGCAVQKEANNYAKVTLKIEEHHLNGINTAQGGSIFTLADFAFAIASNYDGNIVTGINMEITYVKAAVKGDTLTAEATAKYTDTKVPIFNVNITNQNQELVAIFQGMGYRLKNKRI